MQLARRSQVTVSPLIYCTQPKWARRRRRSSFNCQKSVHNTGFDVQRDSNRILSGSFKHSSSSNSSTSLLPPPSPIGSFAASPRKDPESRPSLAVKSSIVTHVSASLLHPSSPFFPFSHLFARLSDHLFDQHGYVFPKFSRAMSSPFAPCPQCLWFRSYFLI